MTTALVTRQQIRSAAKGWARCGVAASEGQVKNWGMPGCARWVVVLTFGDFGGGNDLYICECDNYKQADKLARRVSNYFHKWYAKYREEFTK